MALGTGAAILGGAAISGLAGASSAGKAADAQSKAAGQANALSRAQYNQNRVDNQAFQQNGTNASNQLAYLLGLGPSAQMVQQYKAVNPNSLANAQLVDTSSGGPQMNQALYSTNAAYKQAWDEIDSQHRQRYGKSITANSDPGAISSWLAQFLGPQIAKDTADYEKFMSTAASGDPMSGSLLKKFSQEDLDADPIYQNTIQFAMDNGNKGINQQAAATGGILNGNTLKALSRFGANTAATYGNDSFNRDSATKTRQYNSLAGVAGAGQQAVGQVNSSGQNYANTAGNNLIGAANARGASSIAQGNALSGALSSGFNAYQQNSFMNSLNQPSYGVAQQPGVTGWVSQG